MAFSALLDAYNLTDHAQKRHRAATGDSDVFGTADSGASAGASGGVSGMSGDSSGASTSADDGDEEAGTSMDLFDDADETASASASGGGGDTADVFASGDSDSGAAASTGTAGTTVDDDIDGAHSLLTSMPVKLAAVAAVFAGLL